MEVPPFKLSERDREAVVAYLDYLRGELRLSTWRIDLMLSEARRDAQASIYPTYGREQADLYLGHNFREFDGDTVRHALVHELLHCHGAQVDSHVDYLEDTLGAAAHATWMVGFKQMREREVDAIAHVLASRLKPFEWPT